MIWGCHGVALNSWFGYSHDLCHLFSTFDRGGAPVTNSSFKSLTAASGTVPAALHLPRSCLLEVTHRYIHRWTCQPFPVPNGRRNFTKITLGRRTNTFVSALLPTWAPRICEGLRTCNLQQLSQKKHLPKNHIRTKLLGFRLGSLKSLGQVSLIPTARYLSIPSSDDLQSAVPSSSPSGNDSWIKFKER